MCEAPRALNRAALARQHLLARTASSDEMIERLVDCRLRRHCGPVEQTRRLRATELSALLCDRRAVRASLTRTTIHLVSAHDSMRLSKVYPFGLAKSNNQQPRAQIVPNTRATAVTHS
jgi:hypothetical protein